MWIIAGTIPDPDFSLLVPEGPAPRSASLSEAGLHLPDGRTVAVERGTAALACLARKASYSSWLENRGGWERYVSAAPCF